MPVTIRQIEGIRTTLSNALDISTEPEITSALITALDELGVVLMDLVTADREHAEDMERLRAHVEPKPAPPPTLDLAQELFQMGVAMTRVHMGVVS